MSSREPLWFCHECHAEMRPLMVPDPVCASCHGSFVEKMENAADDPRQFAHDLGDYEGGEGGPEPGVDALLFTLQSLMDRGMGARNTTNQRTTTGPSVTFEVRGPSGSRTMRFGGPSTSSGGTNGGSRPASPGAVPNMSTFIRPSPFGVPSPTGGGTDHPNISGALMTQYLMALLGYHDPQMFGMPENGRMGDYVFNQEALDQIVSQIMENSNAHRPVPATEEIIAKLPREVLMEGSPTLEQDCAVCKEQFQLATEDPDEQVVVTLPCKHPFHQPCILPWLSSSGTCPVCRYALVPQPEQHPLPNRDGGTDTAGGRSRSPPPPNGSSGASQGSGPGRGPESGGLFHNLFSGLSGLAHHHQNNRSSSRESGSRSPRPTSPQQQQQSQHRRSSSDPSSPSSSTSNRRRNQHNGNGNVPGSWSEDLD
ncbi:hypothetical protein BDZ97DRAFT_1784748 [Flammula alnicola]|nr:hypothetical protein BDZ97DRAFT_1784748 [Flammula alnicola]